MEMIRLQLESLSLFSDMTTATSGPAWELSRRRRRLPKYLAVVCMGFAALSVEGFSVHQRELRYLYSPTPTSYHRSKRASTLLAGSVDDDGQTSKNNEQPQQPRAAPTKQTALRWVVQSIERLGEDPEFDLDAPSHLLIEALRRLQRARTQREVTEAGRMLESLDIPRTESVHVQERVIKATALSGLLTLSIDIMESLMDKGHLPSPIAYVPVCNSLRKARRVKRLEKLLYQLGALAEEGVDVLALNTYLAAFCHEDASRLEFARDWLRPGVTEERLGGTEPDTASYATVLHAAAAMGNRRMVDELWDEMTRIRKLQPTIYTYNSLLRVVRNGPDGDAEARDLLDRLWKEVQPDRYTIDLVLVPLIRANRIGDVEALVGNFVESRSVDVRTASNAFAAFLSTLIKAGELPTARAIFDTYLLPSLSSLGSEKCIQPTVRHFNFLIDGYRRVAESNRGTSNQDEVEEESLMGAQTLDQELDKVRDAREKGHALYATLLDTGMVPDAYTLTSMLGLSSTPEEVTRVFHDAVLTMGVEATPAVVRATMIAYGSAGDPASACVIFDEFSGRDMNVRTWNALMTALARGAMLDNSNVLSIEASSAGTALAASSDVNTIGKGVCRLVNGLTCVEAIQRILHVMDRSGDGSIDIAQAPRPNSQTYCVTASALQHDPASSGLAVELFRNATKANLPADGRFINAVLRCFGEDINGALSAWKNEIRHACLAHEHRTRKAAVSNRREKGKNLIASYHGLFYVCGRALRPDIAVRLVYAMNKEEIEADEVALNCYRSGKRMREKLAKQNNHAEEKAGIGLTMSKQFESILLVECTKYDQNDIRRAGEKRVRIIF